MSRILIIEDEEAIADLEKDYLELSGFEVEIENRGDTGLVRAMKEDFDLIILDLMLPEVEVSIFADRSVRRKIRRSSWFLRRRMTSIRSVDLDLVQTII